MDVLLKENALKLDSLLDEQSTMLGQLLELLEVEREALTGPGASRLAQLNKRKEALLLQQGPINAKRSSICDKIARQLSIENEPVNITSISRALNGSMGGRLRAKQKRLQSLAMEIQKAGSLNREMIARSMSAAKTVVETLKEQASPQRHAKSGGSIKREVYRTSPIQE